MAKNMRMDKNAMPEQPAEVRNKNFLEVALGYTAEQAMDEARRCLSCRNRPCVSGCPVGVDIPGFIAKVAEGDFAGAYEVLSRDTSLPAICGRVYPAVSAEDFASADKKTKKAPARAGALLFGMKISRRSTLRPFPRRSIS